MQPTSFCNIECKYCYLSASDKLAPRRMSVDTVDQAFAFLFANSELLDRGEIPIVWASGEPLTVPIEFYEHAVLTQQKLLSKDICVKNHIQTNGMLINQAWCDFIMRSGFRVAVSLDGPKRLHDMRRIDRAGRGTHDQVVRGIELLKQNQIPFDVTGVLSVEALEHVEEIFHFYRELGVEQIGLNCEGILGVNRYSSFSSNEKTTSENLYAFFDRLLELRETNAPHIRLRELDPLLDYLRSRRASPVWMDAVPLRIISISWRGDVSTFSPELMGIPNEVYGKFVFSTIHDGSVADILENAAYKKAEADIEKGIRLCEARCDYYSVCGGGSPGHKLAENGTLVCAETVHCELRVKIMTEVALNYLERKSGIEVTSRGNVLPRIKRLLAKNDTRSIGHSSSAAHNILRPAN